MREILFKAKRKDNGDWVEGYYIYHIKRTICPFGDSIKPEDEQPLPESYRPERSDNHDGE